MKIIFSFVITFLLFCTYSSAQDTVLTFFNKNGKEVKKQKKGGFFVKTFEANGQNNMYLYISDEVKSNPFSSKSDSTYAIQNTYLTIFTEKGKKTHEGMYAGRSRIGNWKEWYEEGMLKAELKFLSDTSELKQLITGDTLSLFYKKINGGLFTGTNVWYHKNGKKAAEEIYETKGKLVTASTWTEEGEPLQQHATDLTYVVQQMPIFIGDVRKFLSENIKYPDAAYKAKNQGRVILEFVVDTDGKIDDVTIINSSGYRELDNEATRVIYKMDGMWLPGKQHNITVPVHYRLPVSFRL